MQKIDTLALFTDLYELTMANGVFVKNKNCNCEFYVSFRHNVDQLGYSIFYGIDDFVEDLVNFRFSDSDIDYLAGLNLFDIDFLNHLKNFRFTGDIYSFNDGDVVFPYEPVVKIRSSFIECTLLETIVLNYLNYPISVATKTSSIIHTAADKPVMEFGLRRAAFSLSGLMASKASFIAGSSSTSDTLAGKMYDIPTAGTMAHAWVMSFDTEENAFRAFADIYPDNAILLIDTYDTIKSGLKNAIKIGLEQKKKGKRIGVRIDSGDLSYLSKVARKELDKAGLEDAIICLSNDIDEKVIEQLYRDKACVDSFGIGTKMVVPNTTGCVYKLCAIEEAGEWKAKMKVSSSVEKLTLPGVNQVYRFFDDAGFMVADLVENEASFTMKDSYLLHHPIKDERCTLSSFSKIEPMLKPKVKEGQMCYTPRSLKEIREYKKEMFSHLDDSHKRLVNPHSYKVSLGDNIFATRNAILKKS